MSPKMLLDVLKTTAKEWSEDKVPRLGAALAYYTVFSLAPLLVIALAIAGLVFDQEAARGQIVGQLEGLVGAEGGKAIQDMIQSASKPSSGIVATIIGVITLLFGASGVFGALQDSLNTIWGVMPKPGRGIMGVIKDRFLSFTMVIGIGFLLLVSLVLSAMLAAAGKYFEGTIPAGVLHVVSFIVSFLVITGLFAVMYKVVPDVKIAWSDVAVGAAATALLFTVGKLLLGLYLGRSSTASSYGAAGSLVIVLLWVYYSAQILFFGAEFTQVYANKYGSRVVPDEDAVALTDEARANQGIPRKEDLEAKASGRATGKARQRVLPAGKRVETVGALPSQLKKLEKQRYAAAVIGFVMALVVEGIRMVSKNKSGPPSHPPRI